MELGIHDLWLFLLTGIMLNLTPGPDMALVIAHSTRHGTRAGIVAALGIGVGAFFHIVAAALGLSAIIMTSATAFMVIKWLGAAYLVYLGIKLLLSARDGLAQDAAALPTSKRKHNLRQIFFQGIFTNALNPKVAIFFLAFLPQFVDPDSTSKVAAFLLLGLLFDSVGTAWNIAVALLAGSFAASGMARQAKIWLERCIGALFIGVGVRLAMSEHA